MSLYNENPIGKVIKDMISQYRIEDKLKESELKQSWEKVVGKVIAQHTLLLFVEKKLLFIKVDSPLLKNELIFLKSKIIIKTNNKFGKGFISDIVIL